MRLSSSLLALTRRLKLIPSAFGMTKQGVKVAGDQCADPSSAGCLVQVGEDACFVASPTDNGRQVLGVADGVGGWKSQGIESAFFSKALMDCCRNVARRKKVDLSNPTKILSRGFKDLMWLHSSVYGSSTACILSFDCNTGLLDVANLGDSGFLAIRKSTVVAKSSETVHYFNCPFQLSNPPPGYDSISRVISDSPYNSHVTQVALRAGDFVLAATDGVFSNLYDSDIVSRLSMLKDLTPEIVNRVAEEIVDEAYKLSLDSDYLSPFAMEGSRALSWEYSGGKPDDITVLLAAVVDSDNEEVPNNLRYNE